MLAGDHHGDSLEDEHGSTSSSSTTTTVAAAAVIEEAWPLPWPAQTDAAGLLPRLLVDAAPAAPTACLFPELTQPAAPAAVIGFHSGHIVRATLPELLRHTSFERPAQPEPAAIQQCGRFFLYIYSLV